jgi:hypothetical protein
MEAEKVRSTLRMLNQLDHAVNLKRCFDELEELERLAKLGKAVEKILSTNESGFGPTMLLGDEEGDINLYTVGDIIEWAEGRE